MNWDQVEGNWKQFTGKAQAQWGEITADEWHETEGRREAVEGKLQERYGDSKEDAKRKVDEWIDSL